MHLFKSIYLDHIAMLSGFMFGSIVEILIYYGVPFPKRTEVTLNKNEKSNHFKKNSL